MEKLPSLSVTESLHSKRNRLFLRLRQSLRFQRRGYRETGFRAEERAKRLESLDESARALWLGMEERYGFRAFERTLSLVHYEKNLATLWTLEQFFTNPEKGLAIVEPGCQDFSRLPAIARFFRPRSVTGIELDPYPILSDFHSRADRARYFRSLVSAQTNYAGEDFFRWAGKAEVLLAFYPFVSPHPALAWGLPAEFGNPRLWARAVADALPPGGFALLVHQGPWEEECFDAARAEFPLRLEHRAVAQCPFSPHPYPPHASLYRMPGLC